MSGVVNFIMRKDFEGLEVDANISQLSQGTNALNQRVSVIYGANLLDDRLNVYGFAEYQTSDVLNDKDLDIGWLNRDERLATFDVDPASAITDGVTDVSRVSNLRSLNRPLGGILSFANAVRPSPASDPDIPFGNCPATQANSPTFAANCFASNPGTAYQFRADGTPYLADFGLGQTTGAVNRTTTIGGSGDRLVAVETNRLPEQEAQRYQAGATFKVTDSVEAFAEYKYVTEENIDVFQPHFINLDFIQFGATDQPFVLGSLVEGVVGLDNAYLDPALRTAIQNNTRAIYNAAGVQTGTVADARAQMRLFSYDLGFRPSIAERETNRFVGGFRGEFDQLGFIKDGSWEVGYTYGQMDAVNTEPETIDLDRYIFSVDAVRDTAGVVNGQPGQIVCRVQVLAANGIPVLGGANGDTVLSPTGEEIRGCVPSNVFGQGGLTAARDYILTSLTTEETNKQHDLRAFVSGNLWDFWGAGPIGFALGGEYRDESVESNLTEFGDRYLFGNSGADLDEVGYDVAEGFVEVRLPLLSDVPFAETLEVTGAYRYSDYSTIGETEAYSLSAFWRPVQDIAFRGTYGESVRAPTLYELFEPPFDTFPNLTDTCSRPVIDATTDSVVRANRIANCAALGIPTTYVDPAPGSSNTGLSGSNPLLQAEESTSYTISTIITPRFLGNFSLVVDYYNIEITNAIATLSAQTLVNLCTDEVELNTTACNVLTRAPAGAINEYEIINFIEGPFNFAALTAEGVDFQASYSFETEDVFGRDYGLISLNASGNWLLDRQNFTSPTDPEIATDLDKTANNPRTRFRAGVTWIKGPLSLTWRADHQTATVITRNRLVAANQDARDVSLNDTGSFTQHDWSAAYDLNDRVALRGGVTNVFDAEPSIQAGIQDQFDLYGRRYFAGLTVKY